MLPKKSGRSYKHGVRSLSLFLYPLCGCHFISVRKTAGYSGISGSIFDSAAACVINPKPGKATVKERSLLGDEQDTKRSGAAMG